MTPPTAPPPPDVPSLPPRSVHRFTIGEYERLVRHGILSPDDRTELVDGWLIDKMPHNPRHAAVLDITAERIAALLPAAWTTRCQLPLRLPGNNVPEPDIAVVRGPKRRYLDRHPTEKDVALVVEVADTSLDEDLGLKLIQYARAKVPVYWVVNLGERRVEVYTRPRGGRQPTYRQRAQFAPGQAVPLVLGGEDLGALPVADLLP